MLTIVGYDTKSLVGFRIEKTITDLLTGIKYKYPLCCILEFCFDTLIGKNNHAFRKGKIIIHREISDYVPCWIHRRLYFGISHNNINILTGALPQVLSNNGEVITLMPSIKCRDCGTSWNHDYSIDECIESCPNCGVKHKITKKENLNFKVDPVFPSLDDLKSVLNELTNVEIDDLIQISKSIGIGAPKPAEMACISFLENFLKRIYEKKSGTLGDLLSLLEKDNELKELAGVVSYFRDQNNKLKHVIGYRSNDERALSTFSMTKELIKTIIYRKKTKLKKPLLNHTINSGLLALLFFGTFQ